jgi:hypothetical protein
VTVGDLVVDHVWRPRQLELNTSPGTPRLDLPCDYMNCRRPLTEHARPTHGREGR